MTKCPFLSADRACEHVSAAVGLPIVITPSACDYCIKNYPDPATRANSYPVQCWTFAERQKRGLSVGDIPTLQVKPTTATQRREHKTRPNNADEMMAAARTVPKIAPAPIVADPQARLEICTDCDYWSTTQQRCKVVCGCTNRPRPLADSGRDCPLHLWKRR
jgi:hypothetical protein